MKKILAVLLSGMLLLGNVALAANDGTATSANTTISAEEPLVLAYNNILSAFSKDNNGQYNYPSSFAGAYLEDQTLYVCLTDTSSETEAYYNRLCSPISPKFVEKEYSLSELKQIKDSITSDTVDNLSTVSIDAKENTVCVGVNSHSMDSNKKKIIEHIPADLNANDHAEKHISMQFRGKPETTAATLVGGQRLTYGSAYFSLGICGTYNGTKALLTCGHGVSSVGDSVYQNGTLVGKVLKKKYSAGGYYDYAIVSITNTSAFTSTAKVLTSSGTQTITSVNNAAIQGMSIGKYGTTTGYTSGVVTNTDCSMTLSGVTIYGLVETNCTVKAGDSGGPFYASSKMYGTVHGIAGSYSYFSPSGAVSGFALS